MKTLHQILLLLLAIGLLATSALAVKGDKDAAEAAWPMIESGALILDVRSPEEFSKSHIEGAINIPHTDIDGLAAALGEDKSRNAVLYCGSGRRAGIAMENLAEMGYTNLHNASGLEALQATQPESTD